MLIARFQRTQKTSTLRGCLILAPSLATITRELVHQYRSLPFATLCLHSVHVRMARVLNLAFRIPRRAVDRRPRFESLRIPAICFDQIGPEDQSRFKVEGKYGLIAKT